VRRDIGSSCGRVCLNRRGGMSRCHLRWTLLLRRGRPSRGHKCRDCRCVWF
jgi:hypothetical protein